MGKLYFYYGCMGSMKSANLIMQKCNYENKNKKVLVLKPFKSDGNEDNNKITSRCGLETDSILVKNDDEALENLVKMKEVIESDIILADEVQFFSYLVIHALRILSLEKLVFCYGLRNNFKFEPFETSMYLMSIADSVREIPTMCVRCKSKAIVNARIKDGKIVTDGELIEYDERHGGTTEYQSLCYKCFIEPLLKRKEDIKKESIKRT